MTSIKGRRMKLTKRVSGVIRRMPVLVPLLLCSQVANAQDTIPSRVDSSLESIRAALIGGWVGTAGVHGDNQACTTCHLTQDSSSRFDQYLALSMESEQGQQGLYFTFSPDKPGRSNKFLNLGEYLAKKLDDSVLRKHLKLGDKSAYVIQSKSSDDPESLMYGDVVLRIENISMDDVSTFPEDVEKLKEDAQLEVEIIRDGEQMELSISASGLQKPKGPYQVGVRLGEIPEALRAHVSLDEGQGVLVNEVLVGSPAAAAGVQVHDILLTADGIGLASLEDLRDVVGESKGDKIEFEILRSGKLLTERIAPKRALSNGVSLVVPGCPALKQRGGLTHQNLLVEPTSEHYQRAYNLFLQDTVGQSPKEYEFRLENVDSDAAGKAQGKGEQVVPDSKR